MPNKAMQANLMMLLAASIWGFAFVAQRVGMETMGPHWFNSLRFFIGVVALTPVVIWRTGFKLKAQLRVPNLRLKPCLWVALLRVFYYL